MNQDNDQAIGMLLIRIPQTYQENAGSLFLYEYTRGFWRVDKNRVDDIEKWPYAAAVFEGKIMEVYKIAKWERANEAVMLTRTPTDAEKSRHVFTGTLAEAEIRNRFRGMSCPFKAGDQAPVRYVELNNEED